VVDRAFGLERLHPRPQRGSATPVQGDARGHAGRDPPVRRRVVVLALAVFCAGLAATLAATARQQVGADPETDARPDGCGRDYLAQAQQAIPTWVYVGDRNAPAAGPAPPQRRLEGLVVSRYERELAVHPTPEDLPTIHRSYDLNLNVLPDRAYRDLLGGSAAVSTGNFAGHNESTGRVHVEREQGSLPFFAWPEAGDRVAMIGSWVWDCGHWAGGGERTELHSYRALWLSAGPALAAGHARQSEGDLFLSSDKTYAGVEADCAHRSKGDSRVPSCLATEPAWQDLSGSYRCPRAPRRPAAGSRLVVRVLDAGSSAGAPERRRSCGRWRGRDALSQGETGFSSSSPSVCWPAGRRLRGQSTCAFASSAWSAAR
jgi:hypothetical protein